MISLLPPPNRHFNYRGRVLRELLKAAKVDLLAHAHREAAENVVREIITKLIKEVPPKSGFDDCYTFEISVCILTTDEYDEAVSAAYRMGMQDALRAGLRHG
jgi:hypothetical protein